MHAYIKFIVRNRFAVLGVMIIITLVSVYSVSRAVVASSMSNFLDENPKYHEYMELVGEFANDEVIIIAYEDDNPLSKTSVARLRKATEDLQNLEEIRRVASILDAPDISAEAGFFSLDTYADKVEEDPSKADEVLKRLTEDPLLSGMLISKDGRHSLLVIELKPNPNRRTESYPELMDEVMAIFEAAGYDQAKLHQTGTTAVFAEVMRQTTYNLGRLFPIVCVVLLVTVFAMFKRFWPVMITGLVAMMAVTWTMGLAAYLFEEINLLMSMVPGFIVIVSFSDVVHLCSSYLLELSHGEKKDQAIEKSCSEVGTACFYTSITTFFGFISVAMIPTPIARQLGMMLGFGVGVALLIAMTLTPVLFALMKEPKAWRTEEGSTVNDLLDKVLDGIAWLTRSYPKLVTAGFILIIGAAIAGAPRFGFETDFVQRFSEDNRLRQDEVYFSEHFVGTNYVDVFIDAGKKNGLTDREVFSQIARFQTEVVALDDVDEAVSIVNVIQRMHQAMLPDGKDPLFVPAESKTIAQYLFLLEDEGDIESMINFERSRMRIAVHIPYDGVLGTYKVGAQVEDKAKEILGDSVNVKIMGLNFLLGEWFEDIKKGQQQGLGFAFATIMIMMIIATRSISAGAWSMIPNSIPVIAVAGFLGWFSPIVDTDVTMVFMVALGIGVDDTIHFLMRYKFELERCGDVRKAVDETFHYSGRAIMITSVILVIGFSPFAFSDYFTTRMMGTLLPGCLVVALVADLFLVPALIELGLFRFGHKLESEGGEDCRHRNNSGKGEE